MNDGDDSAASRVKQIAAVASILLGLVLLVCGALLGWHHLPGVLGEWVGTMVGVMSTPFFLEGSFLVIGITIVMWINHRRQKRDGDELVFLEEKQAASRKPSEERKSGSDD